LGLFPVAVGLAAWAWFGPDTRLTAEKSGPTQAELAAAAGVNPTSLVVDFKDDVSRAVLDANAFDERPVSDYSARDRLYRIALPTAEAAAAAMRSLAADPNVDTVDYDVMVALPPDELHVAADDGVGRQCVGPSVEHAGFPDDPCFRYQWHMEQVGLPGAWKLGRGEGVIVAVIDTGVSRVPDLAKTPLVKGYNFVANSPDASDDHGHGTHVAGTIAQSTNNRLGVAGVAWGATIMPLKVLSANGSGSMAAITQAIRYAADNGAKVINMSLGGPFPMGTTANAIKYARSKGVTVVAAAGNDGKGRLGYPARYPGVIAVGATQFDETTTFYSNWGSELDVAAPGGNVRVDQNGDGKPDGVLQNTILPGRTGKTDYLWFMGTSMASPHAAGVAALIVGAGVTTPQAVEQVLLDTARKPKPKRPPNDGRAVPEGRRIDDHYGTGIVDAGAALRKARAGRGMGELGLGAALAIAGVASLRRRGRLDGRPGLGFAVAVLAGSSGLFLLPLLGLGGAGGGGVASVLSQGFTGIGAAVFGPAAQGNPLLFSAAAPLLLTGVLYGVRRARPAIAGFGFGLAGALFFTALTGAIDVKLIPDFLDRVWLGANACLAAALAFAALRK